MTCNAVILGNDKNVQSV